MGQTFVYNTGTYKDPNPERLHLEFGLFFDGTLNNKDNTDLRMKMLNRDDLKILPTDDAKTVIQKEEWIKKRRERFENDVLTKADKKYLDLEFENIKALEKRLENIHNRKEFATPEETKKIEEIVGYYKADYRSWLDKQGVDNSLMNDYTNVARMWNSCKDKYRIYIEGIGTLNWQKDVEAGFQFGADKTGIRAKVRRGCEELAKKIKPKIPKEKDESIEIIIDVFGFSRGAAAARNFLYEVNVPNKREEYTKLTKSKKDITYLEETSYYTYSTNDFIAEKQFVRKYRDILLDKDNVEVDPKYLIDGKMPKFGYLGYYLLKEKVPPQVLDRIKLKVRFIGIYDTVSSYEEFKDSWATLKIKGIKQASQIKDHFDDDVEQLQLNNIGNFRKAVHFTAIDEHRENFSLTRFSKKMLSNPNNNCIEKAFPGVHCDIGGAYETGSEKVDEIDNRNYNSQLAKLRDELISKYWYKKEQLELSLFKLSGKRFLWKEYSYIPLHFMESYFASVLSSDDYQKTFSKSTKKGYPIDKDKHSTLIQVKEILKKYVFAPNAESSTVKEEIAKLKDERSLRQATKDQLEQKKYKVLLDNKYPDNEDLIKKLNEKNDFIKQITKENPIITDTSVLKKLRNEYLHWSANRDWFGMDPTPDRIRKVY